MAQFRVEFVLDQASGKYIAELYHPGDASRLMVRTRAVYPDAGAALLGVVELFKGALGTKPKAKKRNKARAKPRAKPRRSQRRKKA